MHTYWHDPWGCLELHNLLNLIMLNMLMLSRCYVGLTQLSPAGCHLLYNFVATHSSSSIIKQKYQPFESPFEDEPPSQARLQSSQMHISKPKMNSTVMNMSMSYFKETIYCQHTIFSLLLWAHSWKWIIAFRHAVVGPPQRLCQAGTTPIYLLPLTPPHSPCCSACPLRSLRHKQPFITIQRI